MAIPHRPLEKYYGPADQKSGFLRGIFDRTAPDYDRVEWLIGLGTGSRYRGAALLRHKDKQWTPHDLSPSVRAFL